MVCPSVEFCKKLAAAKERRKTSEQHTLTKLAPRVKK